MTARPGHPDRSRRSSRRGRAGALGASRPIVDDWPTVLEYPIVAVGDVHGQKAFLERLLGALAKRPEWPRCSVVFVGDYVDRGPDVPGTLDLVRELARRHPAPVTAVMGNHDLALVRAAQLDGGPRSAFWVDRYLEAYDHEATFRQYLGRTPRAGAWEDELLALRDAVPEADRRFLSTLPWLVESSGHLFLHCGLSPELRQDAAQQCEALRDRRWDDSLGPLEGTRTAWHWQLDYPVWLGADRRLSDRPLPVEGKSQVTGHVPVQAPDATDVRIRIDTSGGLREPLSACILDGPGAVPVFLASDDQ